MIQLVRAKKDFSPTAASTEIVFAPFASKDVKALRALVAGPWEPALDEQLAKRLKASAKDWTDTDAARVIELSRSNGGAIIWVLVNAKSSVYAQHAAIRGGVAGALKQAQAVGAPVWISLSAIPSAQQKSLLDAVVFLEGTVGWKAQSFGKKAQEKEKATKSEPTRVLHSLAPAAATQVADSAAALARGSDLVRTLAELPSNVLSAKAYRSRIEALAKEFKLGFKFLDTAALKKEKAGAFLAVVSADTGTAAGIAQVSYTPSKGTKKRLALVGKGLCFDTGGYNVKTGDYMLGMHADMTGSAVVLALVRYFAETRAPFAVTAYLAVAENLISPTAYKPNDVVVASNGTSIEVVDTDAEGRMVLSDTLAIASREKPDLLIDFATLTGAAMRALDTFRSAVFCSSGQLAREAMAAGDESGERVWNFPMGDDYATNIKSRVADVRQCSTTNCADHIYAATFLSHFVEKGVDWAHLDLSSCEHKGGLGLIESDTNGFGLRWARALVDRWL